MGGYLLSILGIVILGVVVDVILPSGSTSKYISGIFAIVVMFVIISPILSWVKSGYNIQDYFTLQDISLDEKLLYSINNSKFTELENQIEQELADNGYTNIKVDIQFSIESTNVKITQVLVDLSKLVINENCMNINRYVYIRQVVQSKLSITKEVIVFCE